MFSVRQKQEIADAVQKALRKTQHPELPKGEIRFKLRVEGAEEWSWAEIVNNGSVQHPDVNPWNEMQDAANASGVFHGAPQSSPPPIAPGSKQATICAVCEKYKHTPMRNDAMRGYVCLTCIDRELTRLQSQNKGKKQ
jgi:hypothetical protein